MEQVRPSSIAEYNKSIQLIASYKGLSLPNLFESIEKEIETKMVFIKQQ
jgi:hypothetical protein